ncbi:beta carbonic anhydrase 5, chloroplastic-like isoform X1 [Juglans microcarpa x Juglans regia]|uniref:beta carbonic anhydrase 5, chloroplastic-like isoform X1 n=1 Tax=Juglans microcarpa x Juglans regia TaxID=2249226 RepID=UPI001B7EAC7A|nr:beta carbonic anhydrase 5, chloroplastic-like isoform X1 [Juglans microcarpa x Juglans regia]
MTQLQMRQQRWSAKFVVLLARSVISRMAVPSSSSSWISGGSPVSGFTCSFVGFSRNLLNPLPTKLAKNVETQVRSLPSVQRSQVLRLKAASSSLGSAQEHMSYDLKDVSEIDGGQDLFVEMKQRFLNFKRQKYIKESEYFQTIAEAQYPKFMVIACADSRVCPSNVLGFQPGEAFMIRNVANLVPPLENGPSETNAALEFAVNTLEVENILVIGHSSCGGIQALMSMQDDADSKSFLHKWVVNAKAAKLRAEADAAHYSFDQQCRHCEKDSVNLSLMNLLTYPWIEDRFRKELLSIHGGYYDFLNCTFEKWTLDLKGSSIEEGGTFSVKDQAFWC